VTRDVAFGRDDGCASWREEPWRRLRPRRKAAWTWWWSPPLTDPPPRLRAREGVPGAV